MFCLVLATSMTSLSCKCKEYHRNEGSTLAYFQTLKSSIFWPLSSALGLHITGLLLKEKYFCTKSCQLIFHILPPNLWRVQREDTWCLRLGLLQSWWHMWGHGGSLCCPNGDTATTSTTLLGRLKTDHLIETMAPISSDYILQTRNVMTLWLWHGYFTLHIKQVLLVRPEECDTQCLTVWHSSPSQAPSRRISDERQSQWAHRSDTIFRTV